MSHGLNWEESIYSEGSGMFLNIRNPKIGDQLRIGIRLFRDSPVDKIYLRYTRNGEEKIEQMKPGGEKGKFVTYRKSITVNQPLIKYHFIICTNEKCYFYNQAGLFEYVINEDNDFKIVADYEEPDWVEEAIFYQIFVDRYFNGNRENDIKDGEYCYKGFVSSKRDWNEKPGAHQEFGAVDFFGGDLEGVRKKIPYLKSLGINALYLNPIFEAATNHKYDCNNYMKVDKCFGGNNALIELVEVLHKQGMKIILDISINHTGDLCKWVKEKPEFYFVKPDGSLEHWSGSNNLCTLNYSCEELMDTIYRNEDSVLKHWMKAPFEIDGWRFDVGQNVAKMDRVQKDKEVWREIRTELKGLNPEAYIFTENMFDCREYLQGDMWDGSMNYMGFLRPVRKYLGEFDFTLSWAIGNKKDTVKNGIVFRNEMINHFAGIPYQIQRNSFNLIGSHDIHRIHSSPYIGKKNALTAMIMLMTFKGVPCIYYGDETGLRGETDALEYCRYPMDWNSENWDRETNNVYRYMIKLRRKRKVLKEGCFMMLLAEEHAIAYARFNRKEAILFVNSQYSGKKTIEIPVGYIGDAAETETIYGLNDSIETDGDLLRVKLEAEETLLLDIKLK